jgi:hypothetical protein
MKTNELNIFFQQPSTPLSLNKSYSMHWSARKRHNEDWRLAMRAAYIQRMSAFEFPVAPVHIEFTFTFPKNGRRDPHNYVAQVKPLIDELVLLDLVPDDTAEWVSVAEPKLRIDKDNLCHIRISLRDTK